MDNEGNFRIGPWKVDASSFVSWNRITELAGSTKMEPSDPAEALKLRIARFISTGYGGYTPWAKALGEQAGVFREPENRDILSIERPIRYISSAMGKEIDLTDVAVNQVKSWFGYDIIQRPTEIARQLFSRQKTVDRLGLKESVEQSQAMRSAQAVLLVAAASVIQPVIDSAIEQICSLAESLDRKCEVQLPWLIDKEREPELKPPRLP